MEFPFFVLPVTIDQILEILEGPPPHTGPQHFPTFPDISRRCSTFPVTPDVPRRSGNVGMRREMSGSGVHSVPTGPNLGINSVTQLRIIT